MQNLDAEGGNDIVSESLVSKAGLTWLMAI